MKNYDASKSDPTSVLWGGEIRTDEQPEVEEPLKDSKEHPISEHEEYFIAYVKQKDGVDIDERIVHAEDIASFCFDDKDGKNVIKCEPVLGKDLIG